LMATYTGSQETHRLCIVYQELFMHSLPCLPLVLYYVFVLFLGYERWFLFIAKFMLVVTTNCLFKSQLSHLYSKVHFRLEFYCTFAKLHA
jgi:hypothetical protein